MDNVAINAGKYLQTVVLDNLGTRVPGHVFRQTPDGQEWYYCWRPDFTALLALVNDAAGSGYLLDYADLVRLDPLRPSTYNSLRHSKLLSRSLRETILFLVSFCLILTFEDVK